MFSGAKMPRFIITYPIGFTWITAKISNKHQVRKSLCPTEMLSVELIMFFQPKRDIKQSKNRKVHIRKISCS